MIDRPTDQSITYLINENYPIISEEKAQEVVVYFQSSEEFLQAIKSTKEIVKTYPNLLAIKTRVFPS
ncbi:MAG: hypothetical protein ACXAB7_14345, partial [Candidatus Kariarchaeaceae archaeon]